MASCEEQKPNEIPHISMTNASSNPRTMVVMDFDAEATVLTMFASGYRLATALIAKRVLILRLELREKSVL